MFVLVGSHNVANKDINKTPGNVEGKIKLFFATAGALFYAVNQCNKCSL